MKSAKSAPPYTMICAQNFAFLSINSVLYKRLHNI